MLGQVFLLLASACSLTSAAHHNGHALHPAGLIPRKAANVTNVKITHKLLVGSAGSIQGFDYSDGMFNPNPNANETLPGKSPSWIVFKEPNLLYAIDENSNELQLFNYDPKSGNLSKQVGSFGGSAGVVHLVFSDDKSRLFGSSYSNGCVDVWDATSTDGTLSYLKNVTLPDIRVQDHPEWEKGSLHRAHQAVLDPSNRFLIVNDLSGDALHVLDTDTMNITFSVPVAPRKSGPRHGAFISLNGGSRATHYVVVNELLNSLQLFSVGYFNDTSGLRLTGMQTLSTFGPSFGPANATSARAGELVVTSNTGAVNIYVSNRLMGNETDSISRFALELKSSTDKTPTLVFKEQTSSGGVLPRMFSLGNDAQEELMFVANTKGRIGLAVIDRADANLKMVQSPLATWHHDKEEGFGPQFVAEF